MSSNSVTNAYIDLATFDDIEKHLYGGEDALAMFVRCVQKSNWFSQVPIQLRLSTGERDFCREFSANVTRAGDYLTYVWLRLKVPAVQYVGQAEDANIGWTRNFMHNLLRDCYITFNEINVHEFDNYWLDFWRQHTLDESKRVGYDNMIGNVSGFFYNPDDSKTKLPSLCLNLPLPFFFTRSVGLALPTGAMPFNEIKINFEFRDWKELLVVKGTGVSHDDIRNASGGTNITLGNSVEVWANYAVVTSEERDLMGVCPRDMLIEQVQEINPSSFRPSTSDSQQYDVRLSHAVKALFWAARNKTCPSLWSNYTTGGAVDDEDPLVAPTQFQTCSYEGYDPIALTSIVYENSNRLHEMGSDYFSTIQQWYHWHRIPDETGYHSYSYAYDPMDCDPTGSTNYGKLANASIRVVGSAAGQASTAASPEGEPEINGARYDMVIRALNMNIIRVFGGTLGFPVL